MATDLEREIRELLTERAGDVGPPADAHPTMLRRARRRRIGTAFVSSLVVAGFIAAAVVGTRALLTPSAAPERETRLGGENEETFAVWPQTTREEAREAQECVDLGRAECTWQLNALEVVRRYGEDELGWPQVFAIVRGFNDDYVRLPLVGEQNDIGLVDVVDPLRIRLAECVPGDSGQPCRTADVAVEKLLRPDVTGIWLIVEAEVGTETVLRASPPHELPAAPAFLIERFMGSRFEGSGAERFMTEQALRTYDGGADGLSLYGYTTEPSTTYHVDGWEDQGTSERSIYSVIVAIEKDGSTVATEMVELRAPPCPPDQLCDFDYAITDAERIE